MYLAWKKDPSSVHVSWQAYFKNMEDGNMPISRAFQPPPGLISQADGSASLSTSPGVGADNDVTSHLKVQLLVRAYQSRGHHKAKTDPLDIRGEAEKVIAGVKYKFDGNGKPTVVSSSNGLVKGIDVSKWQGEIDWNKVKATYEPLLEHIADRGLLHAEGALAEKVTTLGHGTEG